MPGAADQLADLARAIPLAARRLAAEELRGALRWASVAQSTPDVSADLEARARELEAD